MTEKAPPDFDWVTARSKCAVDVMFEHLRLMTKKNVETRNALFDPQIRLVVGDPIGFAEAQEAFKAWNRRGKEGQRVEFHLKGDAIAVLGPHDSSLSITLTLDDDGQCKCKVGEAVLDPWQVLRLVLEPVLFA